LSGDQEERPAGGPPYPNGFRVLAGSRTAVLATDRYNVEGNSQLLRTHSGRVSVGTGTAPLAAP
jgi:hypothetical protein